MSTILSFLMALGLAGPADVPAQQADSSPMFQNTGAGDGAGLPGLPGGKAGASGNTVHAQAAPDELFNYCADLMDRARNGSSIPPESDEYAPDDCYSFFAMATPAEPGQAGRGGDGGGFSGLPGGEGGASGAAGLAPADEADASDAADPELADYCIDLMDSVQKGVIPEPDSDEAFHPTDCKGFFAMAPGIRGEDGADANGYKRDGADGPSILGGQGGEGGQAGYGVGGGSGGAGGAGIGGGTGGKGGAGGSAY